MTTNKKQLLLHVYDEVSDEETFRQLIAEEENRNEYEALSDTRALLERHRGRYRPTAAVIDRIMDEVRPGRMRLVYRAIAVAAVLVAGVAVGVYMLGNDGTANRTPVLASEEVPLEWDTSDDIRALHYRLQTIQGASELSWDTPPVPLESLPPQRRTQGLIPAKTN